MKNVAYPNWFELRRQAWKQKELNTLLCISRRTLNIDTQKKRGGGKRECKEINKIKTTNKNKKI